VSFLLRLLRNYCSGMPPQFLFLSEEEEHLVIQSSNPMLSGGSFLHAAEAHARARTLLVSREYGGKRCWLSWLKPFFSWSGGTDFPTCRAGCRISL
jgi:hypothetical protein